MMFVQQVFISSIQRGYEAVRDATRRAVETLDIHPLMAESAGAHVESPQRALLDLVARGDIYLLLIGPRYSKPTEDEFDEARRLAKPILVLRQKGELEPEQQAFLERVAAGWSGGRMWGEFEGEDDVGLAVVRAIRNVEGRRADLAPAALARAEAMVNPARDGGGYASAARIAFAPLISGTLLDAIALDRPGLGDAIADLIRQHRLVGHDVGITHSVSREGVTITQVGGQRVPARAIVAADGAIVCEVDVGGQTDQFAFARVDPSALADGISNAGSFALDVWGEIDSREDVQQIAVTVAIPGAQSKVFGVPSNPNSISMGWGLPQVVVAPQPPVIVRRGEVGSSGLTARLVAEVKRVFADARAVAT